MRDGGKGDIRRKLVVSEKVFNSNWDAIFGKPLKKEQDYTELLTEAPYHPGYEDAVEPSMARKLEPIPFAGMVDTGEDDDSK
jgi:hypothetical protein